MLIAQSNAVSSTSSGVPYTTDDVPSKSFVRDPGVTGALHDSHHHPLAGLLSLATPPRKFCHVIECQPGSCLGKVEINSAGILTLVTSSERQNDKDHQLRIQLAITNALPEDSATLHQNHEPWLRQSKGLGAAPENERDMLRYHPHGLPQGERGQRLPHYHAVLRNGVNLQVAENILRALVNTEVDGKPVLMPHDAAAVMNAAQNAKHYDVASMTESGFPMPLFPSSLTGQQLTQKLNALQAKFIMLCKADHDRAVKNALLPAGFRSFDPVNSLPDKTTRRATNMTCVQHGHTHEAAALRLAQDGNALERLYRGPDGVRKICDLYKFLETISARENYADGSVREMAAAGVKNVNLVLGRVNSIRERYPFPSPRVRSRL